MGNNKYYLLIAVIIAIGLSFFISKEKNSYDKAIINEKLFDDLAGNEDNIASIIVRTKGKAIRLLSTQSGWVLRDKYGYPVDADKVRNIVTNAINLTKVEKKTNNPEQHKLLDLDEPDSEDSDSVRITLMDSTEQNIYADFIVGTKRKTNQIDNKPYFYVRKANENQTWLVSSSSFMSAGAHDFISKPDFQIEEDRIAEATFEPKGAEKYRIVRVSKKGDFKFSDKSKKANDPVILNRMGKILQRNLLLGDVQPIENVDFSNSNKVTYRTYGGLVIEVGIVNNDDQYWLRFLASSDNEKNKQEAENINKLAQNWAYRALPESAKILIRPIDGLLSKK